MLYAVRKRAVSEAAKHGWNRQGKGLFHPPCSDSAQSEAYQDWRNAHRSDCRCQELSRPQLSMPHNVVCKRFRGVAGCEKDIDCNGSAGWPSVYHTGHSKEEGACVWISEPDGTTENEASCRISPKVLPPFTLVSTNLKL